MSIVYSVYKFIKSLSFSETYLHKTRFSQLKPKDVLNPDRKKCLLTPFGFFRKTEIRIYLDITKVLDHRFLVKLINLQATSYYNVNTFRFLIGRYFIVTSFLLEFTAFEKPISINLEPNRDLFHSEAKVTIFNTNGSTNKTELLRPQDHLVYKGLVNNRNHQWAQIMMRNDLDLYPVFEGAFTVNSDIYHIKTTPNYRLSKRSDDPVTSGNMVIYRDSDQQVDSLEKRRDKSMHIMCAMEKLAYNRTMTGYHAAPIANMN
ncbi:hypothetical protein BD770DRAFT_428850 [Pilaira anomala]|nr:hypothetical protein BD770DRAFT_428850 [Pilaira anomala]